MDTILEFVTDNLHNFMQLIRNNKKLTIALGVGVVILFVALKDPKAVDVTPQTSTPEVEVQSVADMTGDRFVTSVGAVEAISEARLQTESGGRVTSVTVKIGDTVSAGTVLATLENASERAALLQAEGSYEAALAASAQSDIGTKEAAIVLQNALAEVSRVNNATYGTVQDVLISTVDTFFSEPNSSYPGVRISTTVSSEYLRTERITLQNTLKTWDVYTVPGTVDDSLYAHTEFIKVQLSSVLNLIDIFRTAVNDTKNKERYTDAEKSALNADLTSARANIVSAKNSVDTAVSALKSAVEGIERAEINAAGGTTSAADAQLKQALGSFRAAQANFEKTVVRTPISGVVNALYLKAGDYVAPGAPAGIVANSNGLEIRTALNQEDASKLTIGDPVTLDGSATGTISAIAGAIDPTTGKVAVTIFVNKGENVEYGTTVTVRFSLTSETIETELSIPLSSIKMTGSGPVVFSVNDAKELVSIPVTLGPVSGDYVVITSGITVDAKIVVDARGLKAGEVVSVTNN
jgi:multidrug efflux pump subunit AcrA (membrane-fusion protein)